MSMFEQRTFQATAWTPHIGATRIPARSAWFSHDWTIDGFSFRRRRINRPNPLGFGRLMRLLRKEKPSIVQSWLYHADLAGILVAPMCGVQAVAWNVRCSNMDMSRYSWLSAFVVR